jgi:hypothetical protein
MASPEEDARRQMAEFEASAEKAYDDLYDSRSPAGCYSDLKDHFAAAIGIATRAGLAEDVARLTRRLEHCKQVYRSQFSSF